VAAGGTPVRIVGENGNVLKAFESGQAYMYAVSASADSRVLAAGGLDGVLRLWTVADGKPLASFDPPAAK
jgi:WD40 repeat protein